MSNLPTVIDRLLQEAKDIDIAKKLLVLLARKLNKAGVKVTALLQKAGVIKKKTTKKGKKKKVKDSMGDTFDVVIADEPEDAAESLEYDDEEGDDEEFDDVDEE